MSFFGRKKKAPKKEYDPKAFDKAQQHTDDHKSKRERVNLGKGGLNFEEAEQKQLDQIRQFQLASVQKSISDWDNPPLTEDEKLKMAPTQRQIQVNRKAAAAHAMKKIIDDPNADPGAKDLARQKYEENKMDKWLELYEMTQTYRAIGDAAQDFGFDKTDVDGYEDAMDKIYRRPGITEDQMEVMENLAHHQKTLKSVEQLNGPKIPDGFETMVPLKEPGFDGLLRKDGGVWNVVDGLDEKLVSPSVSKDPRGIQTAVNGINEFVLLGQNQVKGKLAMKSVFDNGSSLIKKTMGTMLDKVPELAGGDEMSKNMDPRVKAPKLDLGDM